MRPAQSSTVVVIILAALLLGRAPVGQVAAAAAGSWAPVAAMRASRADHTATLLPDGRVLVVGEFSRESTAELYLPASGEWRPVGTSRPGRAQHTATPLPDGQVLVAGGVVGFCCNNGSYSTAERFDPAGERWLPARSMSEQRSQHTATLLADGRVLVTGGMRGNSPGTFRRQATAELYDPVADAWSPATAMAAPRAGHTATRLADGRVLVAGGDSFGTAELYDPAGGSWSPAGRPAAPRARHTATLLPDGAVLVVGGVDADSRPLAGAERYDPATGAWRAAGALADARFAHTATLLPGGQVLVVGGWGGDAPLASAELFGPPTGRWDPAPGLAVPCHAHAATLVNGRVLVIGGRGLTTGGLATVEAYDDGAPRRCFVETGRCLRGPFLARWEAQGGLAINGFPLSEEFPERLEDGNTYTVQYFERVRLEYHPRNAAPSDVLLGQFGRRIRAADPPAPAAPGTAYFTETGHNLGGSFRRYWEANGGLAQFGFPISEEFKERLEDGNTYTVQYFERARFEYHPENPAPYDVLLGQFGRRILGGR